jgi:integrase
MAQVNDNPSPKRKPRRRGKADLGAYLVPPREAGRRFYEIRYSDGSGTRRKSTGTTKRAEAEEVLRRFLEELPQHRAGLVTIEAGFNRWLAVKSKGVRAVDPKKTLPSYRLLVERLLEHLTVKRRRKNLVQIERHDLRLFLRRLGDPAPRGYGLSPRGVKKQLGLARMLFAFLVEERLLREDPTVGLNRETTTDEATPVGRMSEATYSALLATLDKQIETGFGAPAKVGGRPQRRSGPGKPAAATRPRPLSPKAVAGLVALRDFLEAMYWSGIRSVHLASMRWPDIDLDAAVWTVKAPRSKGGVRTFPIRSNLLPLLERRRRLLNTGPFPPIEALRSTWARWKVQNPEFKGTSFHQLRSSFASRAEEAMPRGAALWLTSKIPSASERTASSELLGHGSGRMTATYVDFEVERLREFLEAM